MQGASVLSSPQHRAFRHVIFSRFQCKQLKPDPIDPALLHEVLALTLRAPSSFNTQPFKVVIVEDADARARLAAAMIGPPNIERVKNAPCTAIFCADTTPVLELPRLQALWHARTKAPATYIDSWLPARLKVSSGDWYGARWLQPLLFADHLEIPQD